MNGIKPLFLENTTLVPGYYDAINPYADAPVCKVNLLELSRYAKGAGKKLVELTKEEVDRFVEKPNN